MRLARIDGTAKARLTFLFSLPHRGRVDISGPMGRTVSNLFIELGEACLILPEKRVYWLGAEEEVLSKLLGFPLSYKEMTSLLIGRWEEAEGWGLERDGRGRITRGEKDSLRFEVKQYFEGNGIPRLLTLSHGMEKGSLKILRLYFNQPLKDAVFDRSFLREKDYRPATWEEIEALLRDED